jgi:hypothetical protein
MVKASTLASRPSSRRRGPFRSLPFSSLPFCSLPRHFQSKNYIGGFSLRYSPSYLTVCLSLGISLFTINPLCRWLLFVPCIWTRFHNGVLWRYPLADMPVSQCEPVRPQFALHDLPTSLLTLALVHADEYRAGGGATSLTSLPGDRRPIGFGGWSRGETEPKPQEVTSPNVAILT